ncbi:MAG: hypothetical protein ACOYOI_08800 [Chthoniobacterales bacterium]
MERGLPISEITIAREIEETGETRERILERMAGYFALMRDSVREQEWHVRRPLISCSDDGARKHALRDSLR